MAGLGLCIVGGGRFAGVSPPAGRGGRGGRRPPPPPSRAGAPAEPYRRRYGGVAAFGSYEAAAADPRVHALVFCTPHHLHGDNLRLAAAHGKAVLLEKPIARTLEEADAMLAEARAAGIPFMVGENFPFMPALVAARRLLAEGALGGGRPTAAGAPRVAPP